MRLETLPETPMLAHRASAQGEMVAEIIAGHVRVWDKVAIPVQLYLLSLKSSMLG